MKLVIVESPAKAKTINKYLGNDFTVMASFGHIRDLPAKDGSVHVDDGFSMDWELQPRGVKVMTDIVKALAKSDALYLASDPDREGEAIAWHVVQELKRRKKLAANFPVHRVVFNEITKKAVNEAMQHPRDIDMNLVDAYLARRALDYLVGFNISPLLWRKLPSAKSAGRVQSVALRLITEREDEIESFVAREYWDIATLLKTPRADEFTAKLTRMDGKKLDKFDLANGTITEDAKKRVESAKFSVESVEKKQTKRNPAPAFTTSTLQQEASRKLGMGAKKAMQTAQSLYEGVDIGGETVGLITYMRTDSVALAAEAMTAIRDLIGKEYGPNFVPEKPRFYKNNSKNAQEAHEAIRPTNVARKPEMVAKYLNADQLKLYDLIWKRTVACQMESAIMDKVGIDIVSEKKDITLRATGQTIAFAGFIKVYKEDVDEKNDDDDDAKILPVMSEGEALTTEKVTAEQHFTEPPPRYSEASLVKKLEELGIGRPSTYATILSVLQDRNYVKLVQKRFIPEDSGRIVTIFLENYFNRYVQYDFTAQLENKLDEITEGKADWQNVLSDFWKSFHETVQKVEPIKMGEVLEKVSAALEKHLFATEESRKCPECGTGRLGLRVGKFGAFVGCSNYPKCKYTKPFVSLAAQQTVDESGKPIEQAPAMGDSRTLGKDAAGNDIVVKNGPYGWYVQLGAGKTAKRTSLPKNIKPEEVDIKQALGLLSLPRALGNDPKTGEMIDAGLGKFGPYVRRGKTYKSLTAEDNVLTVDLPRALALLSTAREKPAAQVIGKWDGKEITYQVGKYGPYVKCGKVMASVRDQEKIPTEEEAVKLLQDKMHQK